MLKRTFLAIAVAIVSLTAAQANDRPTDKELLKAAQTQGILGLKTVSGLPTDHTAWSIKAILIDTEAKPESENVLRVFAQIETNADLFIESRKHEGSTLVTPTFQTGASISLPGKLQYERVGFFNRSWEIKFSWDNAMPPGMKLSSFEKPVSTQSEEGRSLSERIAGAVTARIKEQVAEAEAKKASFAMDRKAAEEKMSLSRSKDEADIIASLAKFVGKWLPYTIVTPTDDPKNPKSDFRAVHVDDASADGVSLTLLLGSDEQAKRAAVSASVADGKLNFADSDGCQIEVVPSRKESGEVYMLFGSRLCSVTRQHLSIVLEERTPKEIAAFIARMNSAPPPPPTKPALPLPSLKP